MVPLNPANQRLTVGILSYDGGVSFGLLADRDLDPPVDRGGGRSRRRWRSCWRPPRPPEPRVERQDPRRNATPTAKRY